MGSRELMKHKHIEITVLYGKDCYTEYFVIRIVDVYVPH